MRAQVLREFGRPLALEELADPRPGPGEALLRVGAAGVCATDLTIQAGSIATVRLPHVPGHEIAGVVDALGPGLEAGVGVGDHVVVRYYLTCERCEYCRSGRDTLCTSVQGRIGLERAGGYAELVAVPVTSLHRIARSVPFGEAAVLADAGAASLHALTTQGRLREGERAIVVGGGGGLGLIAVQLARLLGAHVSAVDLDERKLEAARQAGAHEVALGSDDWPGRLGRADLVLDLVGEPDSISAAVRALAPDGRLVLESYGTGRDATLTPKPVIMGQLHLIGSRGSYRRELAEIIRLVEAGRVRPVIGATYPLEAANDALADLAAGRFVGRAILAP